jgi:hypothetical protein
MGEPEEQFEWPDDAEEVEAEEVEAEAAGVEGLRRPGPASPDEDDERFLRNMATLTSVRRGGMGAGLAFSDGVTNHVVTCLGILRVEGRHYIIGYLDSWGREGRGTFLEEGKNVAGVKARREDEEGVTWSVTHEEFFRVFDQLIFLNSGLDGGREVYGRAEEEGEGR